MPPMRFSKEEELEIVKTYDTDMLNKSKTAEKFNCSTHTITKVLRKYGVADRYVRRTISGPTVKLIKQLLKEGKTSQTDIAKKCDVSISSVCVINRGMPKPQRHIFCHIELEYGRKSKSPPKKGDHQKGCLQCFFFL